MGFLPYTDDTTGSLACQNNNPIKKASFQLPWVFCAHLHSLRRSIRTTPNPHRIGNSHLAAAWVGPHSRAVPTLAWFWCETVA